MRYFYINRFIHFLFIFSIFTLYVIGFSFLSLFCLISYGIALLLFRRKVGVFKENISITDGILYAPSNGKVIGILPNIDHPTLGKNFTEVVIRIPWNVEYGIYLPYSSEIKDLVSAKGREHFRYSKEKPLLDRAGLLISLKDSKGDEIGLQLIKCPMGLWPEIKVMPGDRGKRQANIGLLPFGGTLVLYIPNKYEILIQVGQELMAGESLIAGHH
ncbi:MAG: phosphatidylserine decarboxylase [Bacteriovoracaceae bacterium]